MATLCPAAAPVPSCCPSSAVPTQRAPLGTGHGDPDLHAAEERVDGRLFLAGTVAHLLYHGLEEDDRLARGGLQLLHSLRQGQLQRCGQHRVPPAPQPLPTITAWSSRWQPCMYAVSMSMQCARLSLRERASGHGAGQGAGQVQGWAAHPCMSLKQLMQSMDFFSVENMM